MGPDQYYGYQPQQQYQQDDPAAKKRRIIIFVGGILGLFVVLGLVMMLLLSSSSAKPLLVKIAAQQNEMARVAELGIESDDARRDTQNIAASIRATSLSNVTRLATYSKDSLGEDLSKSEKDSEKNSNTDDALVKAGDLNEYDATFAEAMESMLSASNRQMGISYVELDGYPGLQAILNDINENNKLLLEAVTGND